MKKVFQIIYMGLAGFHCSIVPVGGGCTYQEFPGTATIVSVTASLNQGGPCLNPVDVVYDFTPDNLSMQGSYGGSNPMPDTGLYFNGTGSMHQATYDTGSPYYPVPQDFTVLHNLVAGSSHPVTRIEARSGSCFPTSFRWSEIPAVYNGVSCSP